jgi:ubiquinone/menaquinone biosynthesis C-methylase UbiE
LRLDIDPKSSPDICSDLHKIDWESEYFDTVIATEVLEHLRDPAAAISEIYRVLKPGGVCVASTRFIFRYHPDPQDFYRFTHDSLEHLFRKFGQVEILHHRNRLAAIWQLLNSDKGKFRVVLNVMNPTYC